MIRKMQSFFDPLRAQARKSEHAAPSDRAPREAPKRDAWDDALKEVHPWVAGAVEWSGQYGSFVARIRALERLVLCLALVLMVAVGGIVYLATHAKYLPPYIVQVDKTGFTVAVKPAERMSAVPEQAVHSAVAKWILGLRSVRGDAGAQRELLDNFVYAHLAVGSAAREKVNAWFKENNPFEKLGTRRVEVDIHRTFAMRSDKQWTVEWSETTRSGTTVTTSEFSAFITIRVSPQQASEEAGGQRSQKDVHLNAFGIFIEDYTITKL